jgi:hypothetical protein
MFAGAFREDVFTLTANDNAVILGGSSHGWRRALERIEIITSTAFAASTPAW